MYLYETHLHTTPNSACARADIRETLTFYSSVGYAGVLLTDHFIDDGAFYLYELPFEERIKAFFSVKKEAEDIGKELGLSVFFGFEMSHEGTHFLVYGIDEEWCLSHPDMDKMKKSALLSLMMEEGALIIQAHPFREARFIDHIQLFPRHVHGVEVYNASRIEFENELAEQYCKNYELIRFAGSDNHGASKKKVFGGMATESPMGDVREFIDAVKEGRAKPFARDESGVRII